TSGPSSDVAWTETVPGASVAFAGVAGSRVVTGDACDAETASLVVATGVSGVRPPEGGGSGGCSDCGVSANMRKHAITKPTYSSGASDNSVRLCTATEYYSWTRSGCNVAASAWTSSAKGSSAGKAPGTRC